MFVRIETGPKAEFSDPEAQLLWSQLKDVRVLSPGELNSESQAPIAERLRWLRKMKVFWVHLSAPRDRVVQAVQLVFKNRVTDWVFTGDLLPSAAGVSGTLFDLMQEAPHRPGVFHGIEKRTRLQMHDEDGGVLLDALQTILGRRSTEDRVVSGELLLVEGAKLTPQDLEWLAKYWFAHESQESWSILSEEELKKNSRFQGEQVAKYLSNPAERMPSRLLQFRQSSKSTGPEIDWTKIQVAVKAPLECSGTATVDEGEEFNLSSEIRFHAEDIQVRTQAQVESQLVRQQLWHEALQCEPRLQTVLSVLPDAHRLWRGELHGSHPLRVQSEFHWALKRIAETTDTPVVHMKSLESADENEPSYFWSSTVAVGRGTKSSSREVGRDQGMSGLFWISHSDLISAKLVQFALEQCLQGQAIQFSIPASGLPLLEVLKRAKPEMGYGFDLVVDGVETWFQKHFLSPLPLGQIWGVKDSKREWVIEELRTRGITFVHFGTTSMNGDVRILEKGEVKIKSTIKDFFNVKLIESTKDLLDEPLYLDHERKQPKILKNRFSTEELVLKPEGRHVSIASPVVIRPSLSSWSGVMVLSDLQSVEFDDSGMEYLFRKCTAVGGVIHSIQTSMVNGLKRWKKILDRAEEKFSIQHNQKETVVFPAVQSHWLALQLICKVNDIRSIRSEDFKHPQDRIYWLPGAFDDSASKPVNRWLACMEGRYQNSLHNAVAIERSEGRQGVINTLIYALTKRKLGAELKVQHHFPGGYFVSMSENERFAVEEEWRMMGIEFEFVGRTTSSPFLVIRDENDRAETVAIEDLP